MKKLKILILAPTPYFSDRGCHVRIYEEARVLSTLGHELLICTYHLGRDPDGVPVRRIPAVPWYRKQSAGPSWHKPYLDVLLFFTAFSSARRFRPDLIHAHLHEGAFIGYFLKKCLGIPMVFDCQGSLTAELLDHGFVRRGSLLYRLFYALEARINRGADQIITSSTPTAQLLLEEFGLPAGRVTAVVDGVDTEVFRPGLPVETLRRELGLPSDRPVVVYLGAMTDYQGVDLLLEAIRLLGQREVDAHFLLMGYPEEKYRARAAELGIAARVTFTGRIDYGRAPEYLCLGDLAVSPKLSRTEANGKLFNYMACGLLTVVFDTPVNREILGETGIYAAFGSVGDFAAKIAEALSDGALRQSLSRRVRARAEEEHSWRARGRLLDGVYGKVRTED